MLLKLSIGGPFSVSDKYCFLKSGSYFGNKRTASLIHLILSDFQSSVNKTLQITAICAMICTIMQLCIYVYVLRILYINICGYMDIYVA